MLDMVRVFMLAPYRLGNKEFLQYKIYFVERQTADRLTLDNAAKIISSALGGFENKQIKINY